MVKQTGLGRGFGSLIPQNLDAALLVDDGERVQKLAVTALAPNPEQPRTVFDADALGELASSIKQYGIIQPLVVTPEAQGYHIIAGERRWRAAQMAGLKTVPALVRTAKQQEKLELAILENVQRVDLSPLEQAVSVERLHQQFNLTYGDIAKRLGKAETTVHNTVRLLQLPAEAREALQTSVISEGHARQVLALKDSPEAQAELLKLITQNGWSVRQAERYVSSLKAGVKERQAAEQRVSGDTPETQRLSQRFGTKVRIHRTAKGGRVEIAFTSEAQLAKLLTELED
ncbi:MAG TPA: ParB/RepB/Spo0J family partition protein [Candidatus Saccharimonadales bacterium]|nr:ParB/RepB/Spo0J family partition protein [Candidatus Saccharimonadales bacterium]